MYSSRIIRNSLYSILRKVCPLRFKEFQSTQYKNVIKGGGHKPSMIMTTYWLSLFLYLTVLLTIYLSISPTNKAIATPVLMRVCDTREVKTVTSRVCMLYKRTKNSEVKLDKQGNLRLTRQTKSEYSPAKLASDCCKIGCPPHIFANIC